jgi:hypothetical protein
VATASSWMRKSTTVGGGGRGGDSCTAPAHVGGREQPATREEDGGGRIERQGRAAEGWEGVGAQRQIGSGTKLEWETLILTRVGTSI